MSRVLTYAKAINEALFQSMERDASVFILGEDVAKMGGDFGITQGISYKWPDRIFDTALSESAILGLSNGAALCGLRPVPEIMFADFLGVCYDQLVNNAAKLRFMFQGKAGAPITVRAVQGAGIRCAYHHSACVESWFMNTPGLVVVSPSSPYEAKGMLNAAIRNDNPVIFLEHKLLYNTKGEVPEEYYEVPLYEAEVEREGSDVTIIGLQITLPMAHAAAKQLEKKGVSCEIIDLRTVAPYDKETLKASVAKTGRLVIAQEGPRCGGWAAELSAMISEDLFEYLRAPIKRVTSLDVPIAFAPALEDFVLPKTEQIVAACEALMEY
ncbi:MAG: alpha-ketoacid dehydrogenase subunit beta [Christensenellaceae bacterium]|jgi:pyruvate dehydrogenase E1 component beta subunit|nr:alpha-ketoacid dehydrogenase subunit beta [Christensenellaceae bacterium]